MFYYRVKNRRNIKVNPKFYKYFCRRLKVSSGSNGHLKIIIKELLVMLYKEGD